MCYGNLATFQIRFAFIQAPNPLTAEWAHRALIDFTRLTPDDFTRQWGTPWQGKG